MSDLEYSGKIATKTFKQVAHKRLIKAKVIPASELAKQKDEAVKRAKEFSRSIEDESFYARTEKLVSSDSPISLGRDIEEATREPFEDSA